MSEVLGTDSNETLIGTSEADTILGAGGNDQLEGAAGDDVLEGGAGNDALNGGEGEDVASYGHSPKAVRVDLALAGPQNTRGAGVDTLSGIEHLTGSGFNDSLFGDGGANIISGGAGNDTLDGRGGVDTMLGGVGNDIYYVDDFRDEVVELTEGGTDTVYATTGYWLRSNVENLVLLGVSDLSGEGNALNNKLTGNSGPNSLSGYAGNDSLYGLDGNDSLDGGDGNDGLWGGNGNDDLYAHRGNDVLWGGNGTDHFHFYRISHNPSLPAERVSTHRIGVLDFSDGDVINLSQIYTWNLEELHIVFVAAFGRVPGEATLTYRASNSTTLFQLDIDGNGRSDLNIIINGDVTGTTANLYTGPGDSDGGWVL